MQASAYVVALLRQIRNPRVWWVLALLMVMALAVVIYQRTGDPSAPVATLFVLFLCVRAWAYYRRNR
jgi:cbb3-type cytochrome oxidase subunit 3